MGKSTNALIKNLTADLKPVQPMVHPALRAVPWIVLAIGYMVFVIAFLGVRSDITTSLQDNAYLFEISLISFVALSAALVSSWLCIPDMRGSKWMMAVPLAALGVFILWTGIKGFTSGFHIPEIHWDHCFIKGAMMGFVPMVALILLSRCGATTYPIMMSLMNTLAVGALGYVGLRLVCIVDTIGHTCFYHLFPFMVFGLVVGVAARKLYSW